MKTQETLLAQPYYHLKFFKREGPLSLELLLSDTVFDVSACVLSLSEASSREV